MDMMLLPLRRYAEFFGRSSRAEYWLFVLFVVVASAILTLVDTALGLGGGIERRWLYTGWSAYGWTDWHGGLLTRIFALLMIIPGLAVAVRRLHDTNRSGWWLLIVLVPFIGWLVLLVFYVQPSWPMPNRWGAPAALPPA